MTILKRIVSLFKGQANSILDELEKTKSASEQLVRELKESLSSASIGYRDLLARRELLEGDLSKAENAVQVWESALLAAETKDPTLLGQCTDNLRRAMSDQDSFKSQLAEANEICIEAELSISKMKRDIDDLTSEIRKLAAQYQMAKAQGQVSGANLDSAKAQIARMQDSVNRAKAEVKANRLVETSTSGEDILEKLQQSKQDSTADLLASIKARRAA
jgi:phage shock protein A